MDIIISSTISGLIALIVSGAVNYHFKKKNDKYIAKLDKENYITKTQFDYEFRMYQELSLSAFECVSRVELLFPIGFNISPEHTTEYHLNNHKMSVEKLNNLSLHLYKSEGFMNENIFKTYGELLNLCNRQVMGYHLIYLTRVAHNINTLTYFDRTIEIQKQYKLCSKELRDHLKTLRVID